MNSMTQARAAIAAIALVLAWSPAAFADPPANKGSQGQGQAQGQSKGNPAEHARGGSDSYDHVRYDDKNTDSSNHGQVVSECNHRANERNLKGHDRKEWTEWCEERGSRHNYDYQRYSSDRTCYQKADKKGLSGDKRRRFVNDCLGKQVYGNR
jgi:hypothetical protein